MAKKGILPLTLKMTLKKYYPQPVHQPLVPPHPEIPPFSSPLPCTETVSSGDVQTESDSLGAPADGQEAERLKIPLVVRPDMTKEIHLGASTGFKRRGQGGAQARMSGAKITTGWYGVERAWRASY